MRYIKGLDTLRAFAVIFVIYHHWGIPYRGDQQIHDFWTNLLPTGNFGVDLFFVLSGFLITSILMDALKKDPDKLRIIRNFIIRRSLRIFPIYYLTIFVLLLAKYPNTSQDLVWCLTYTYNILTYQTQTWRPLVHLWSLSVEEQFYLIWPWCIVFVPKKYVQYVFLAAVLIGMASLLYTTKVLHNNFGKFLMPSCMESFGAGGFYAWLSSREKATRLFIRICTVALPFAVAATIYWSFAPLFGHLYYWFRTAYDIISIWLIHQVIHARPGWFKKNVLENPVLLKIGQISYGIYLFHKPLPWFSDRFLVSMARLGGPLSPLFSNWYFAYLFALLLLFALALASFHFFEKPVMRLKRYFEY